MENKISKHITLDTVRLIANSDYIISANSDLFKNDIDTTTGEIRSIEFNSRFHESITPFKLYILANNQTRKLTLEFSSKLLLGDYPKLISRDTFGQCLRNIEKLGICSLDIDRIIENGYFNKLHITKDVELELTPEVLDRLNLCTGNYRRYKWVRYENNAILFSKNVKSNDCKEEISIYNKAKEIQLSKNKPFLNQTNAAETIKEYFNEKTRFEVKLETTRKIKKELGIEDTSINRVLSLDKNVVLTQFDKIFSDSSMVNETLSINNITDYGLFCAIRYHKGNMQGVEQEVKDFNIYGIASRGAYNRQMQKVKKMAKSWSNQEMGRDNAISQIRELLHG